MDSGLGSDEEQRRTRTKEQKQRLNEQLLNGAHCFIDASSLQDDEVDSTTDQEQRKTDERRQGALLFQTGIPQYSTMLQLAGPSDHTPPDTPYNSMVQVKDEVGNNSANIFEDPSNQDEENRSLPSLGFYVDFNDLEVESNEASALTTKNIFSMVIDFEAPKKDMPTHLFRNTARRKSNGAKTKSKLPLKTNCAEAESCSKQEQPTNAVESIQVTIECVDEDNSSKIEPNSIITDASSETRIDNTEKTPPPLQSDTKFVRLSDLMCQNPMDNEVCNDMVSTRLSRSIPESSWVESPLLMSRSAGFRIAPRPLEPDVHLSDSTGSQTGPSQRRLGTDLLRMFLEELDTDTVVHIGQRTIKAHRCILISRCQYFAGTLRGNAIELDGFTYDAVHFAMCHIYSGASHVPDSISLVELASLADMLSLEGLKEVVSHALKSRHCHHFHSPCAGCLTGVLEVLPLSSAYGLDELYQKCLKWITLHYLRIWPSRAFASLPKELREKCFQQHVVHMSAATVLNTCLSTDRLLASLPNLKWAEPVVQHAAQLLQTCHTYITQHFLAVLPTLLDAEPWHYPRIEEVMFNAAAGLTLDQDCGVYTKCSHLLEKSKLRGNATLVELLSKLKQLVEKRIVLKWNKLSKCQRWQKMEPELRAHIKTLAKMSESMTKTSKFDVASRLPRMIANKTATSSSESSRNSSPATSQSHTSPSLRRSLLLAARAPQVPPSPSTTRRISTLTMPTAASAAKSAAPRQVKSQPLHANVSKIRPMSAPAKSKEAIVKKEIPKRPPNSAQTRKTTMSVGSKKVTDTTSKTSEKIGTKRKVVAKKVGEQKARTPVMQRSSTFLIEEPTILNKISSHGKM